MPTKTSIKKWAQRFECCSNCTTTRFPHSGLGYCSRCKSQIRAIQEAKAWDWKYPKTFRKWKPPRNHTNNRFGLERERDRRIRKANRRLTFYRVKEEKLRSAIQGDDIFRQLQFLVYLIKGRRPSLRVGIANDLTKSFNLRRRKILFGILNEVIEALKLRGVFAEQKWTC